MGDALAHGVLPGIALAFLWGIDVTIGALVSAAVMVAGIDVVHRRARLPEDTGIGLLFVGMLALGVIIASTGASAEGLEDVLFGDVLGVTHTGLVVQALAAALVLFATVLAYRPFLVLSFNPAKASSLGLRPKLAHLALLALVATAVVSSFQVVGSLLVFGLLIAPPATAALLVRRVWLCMVVAVLVGWVAVAAGLVTSYYGETAAGATMAAVSVGLFFVVLVAQELVAVARRPG
jgi:ABC-type Mn2+/Zn2+ transport system permease subunit